MPLRSFEIEITGDANQAIGEFQRLERAAGQAQRNIQGTVTAPTGRGAPGGGAPGRGGGVPVSAGTGVAGFGGAAAGAGLAQATFQVGAFARVLQLASTNTALFGSQMALNTRRFRALHNSTRLTARQFASLSQSLTIEQNRLNQAFNGVRGSMRRFIQSLDAGSRALARNRQRQGEGGGGGGGGIPAVVAPLGPQTSAGRALARFPGAGALGSALGLPAGLAGAGLGAGLGIAIISTVQNLTRNYVELERAAVPVQQLIAASFGDEGQAAIRRFSRQIRDLGVDLGRLPTEIFGGAFDFFSIYGEDLDQQQLDQLLRTANLFSRASGLDLRESAGLLSIFQRSFFPVQETIDGQIQVGPTSARDEITGEIDITRLRGLNEVFVEIAALINRAGQISRFQTGELAVGAIEPAQFAAGLGESLPEFLAQFVQIAAGAGFIGQATTRATSLLNELQELDSEIRRAIDEQIREGAFTFTGLGTEASFEELIALPDFSISDALNAVLTAYIEDALEAGLTEQAGRGAFTGLFGRQEARFGAIALVGEGAEGVEANLADLLPALGISELAENLVAAADIATDTLDVELQELGAAFTDFKSNFLEATGGDDGLIAVIDAVTAVLNGLSDIFQTEVFQQVFRTVITIAGLLNPVTRLGIIISEVADAWDETLIPAIQNVGEFFMALASPMETFLGILARFGLVSDSDSASASDDSVFNRFDQGGVDPRYRIFEPAINEATQLQLDLVNTIFQSGGSFPYGLPQPPLVPDEDVTDAQSNATAFNTAYEGAIPAIESYTTAIQDATLVVREEVDRLQAEAARIAEREADIARSQRDRNRVGENNSSVDDPFSNTNVNVYLDPAQSSSIITTVEQSNLRGIAV